MIELCILMLVCFSLTQRQEFGAVAIFCFVLWMLCDVIEDIAFGLGLASEAGQEDDRP